MENFQKKLQEKEYWAVNKFMKILFSILIIFKIWNLEIIKIPIFDFLTILKFLKFHNFQFLKNIIKFIKTFNYNYKYIITIFSFNFLPFQNQLL